MNLIEELIVFIVQCVLRYACEDLKFLKRDISCLEKIQKPFPRMHYEEACRILLQTQPDFKAGSDFGGADETILSSKFEQPLFIHHYPKECKSFLYEKRFLRVFFKVVTYWLRKVTES